MHEPRQAAVKRPLRTLLLRLLPFSVFIIFVIIAVVRITGNDGGNELPDALAGKAYPPTSLPVLGAENDDVLRFNPDAFKGRVILVNFWGSWCPPCRQEHPQLMKLATDPRFDVVGVNFQDTSSNGRRFLGTFGNPFKIIGVDPKGRTAINWGVYGPPETFLVNKNGIIVYKYIGPLTPKAINEKLMPEIEKALHHP